MFFCSWGIWWSFFSRWLTDPTHGLGMSSAEQGQIYSINSLATLVIMFVYGTIQDQLVANGLIHIGMSSLIIFCSANCWRVIIQQFSYSKNHAIFPGVILSFSVRFFV